MPRRQTDTDLLADVVKASRAAQRYAVGVKRETLRDDHMRASAIIWQLGVAGYAASKLSGEFIDSYPAAPWRNMTALRRIRTQPDRLIDFDQVWIAVSKDVPALLALVDP
jgi:uncharacterized protein with HEPN domain